MLVGAIWETPDIFGSHLRAIAQPLWWQRGLVFQLYDFIHHFQNAATRTFNSRSALATACARYRGWRSGRGGAYLPAGTSLRGGVHDG